MSSGKTIAILFHHTRRENEISKYRITYCARFWKEAGLRVRIARGLKGRLEADLVIPQIDLSVLPEEYRLLLDRQKLVVNRRVADIRKRSFSPNLLSENDHYEGPVIVKTDANCGGDPEHRALLKSMPHMQILPHLSRFIRYTRRIIAARSLARLTFAERLRKADYTVFSSLREVPRAIFRNPALVIEKFLPEREGPYYFSRSYAFFGDQEIVVRARSMSPVVKAASGADLDIVPVDPAIVAAREKMGFDYGKFDYVRHEGETILIDVNPTPTFGDAYSHSLRREIAGHLAKGISRWFPQTSPSDYPPRFSLSQLPITNQE
jgi:hypothetical protein